MHDRCISVDLESWWALHGFNGFKVDHLVMKLSYDSD